jgi:hypothetical protein
MINPFYVSSPHKGETFVPAHVIAEAVRLLTGMMPRAIQSPSGIGADAGSDWDASEYEAIGSGDLACHLGGIERSLRDIGFARSEDDDGSHLPGFQLFQHRDTVRPRKPLVNKDKAYRARAKLREEYRRDPDAFVSKIPVDIADRVTIRDRFAEACALLDAVDELLDDSKYTSAGVKRHFPGRPLASWLNARKLEPGEHGPEEHVRLVNYQPPPPRLRSRPMDGIEIFPGPDGSIGISLRKRELPRLPRAGHSTRAPANV